MLSPFLSLFYILTLPVLSWFLQLSLSYHPNLLCDRYCMSISLCSMFMESCRVLPLHSARTWNICSGSFPFNIPSAHSWLCWNTLYLIQETALTEIGYWQDAFSAAACHVYWSMGNSPNLSMPTHGKSRFYVSLLSPPPQPCQVSNAPAQVQINNSIA